jgi:hypothetical protein
VAHRIPEILALQPGGAGSGPAGAGVRRQARRSTKGRPAPTRRSGIQRQTPPVVVVGTGEASGYLIRMSSPTVATIGVYGASLESFLDALLAADVKLLLDVRQRRGVRGRDYA